LRAPQTAVPTLSLIMKGGTQSGKKIKTFQFHIVGYSFLITLRRCVCARSAQATGSSFQRRERARVNWQGALISVQMVIWRVVENPECPSLVAGQSQTPKQKLKQKLYSINRGSKRTTDCFPDGKGRKKHRLQRCFAA